MDSLPLRSATDRSDPGFVRAAAADRTRIAGHVDALGAFHSLPGGDGLLVRARYPAFEGPIGNGPHLRIALCTGPATRLVQDIGSARLEGQWQPGTLAIMPPQGTGFAACGPVTMIGLAILPGPDLSAERLHGLAAAFRRDDLIASVLTALHHEAAAHGTATAFFEHGVALILRRLQEPCAPAAIARPARPLSEARYRRLLAYAEAKIGDDVAVVDMAAVVGMDPSGFARALRARTGLAPYAWLTRQRMDHAARLLADAMTVTQVAGRVGYANAGKFAAAFRRFHGMPPSRWRMNS